MISHLPKSLKGMTLAGEEGHFIARVVDLEMILQLTNCTQEGLLVVTIQYP
jgi:hypothetical protein